MVTAPLTPKSATAVATKVEVRDLRLSYGGKEVIHGISFDIYENEIIGIIGPAQSGKTSLLRILATSIRPTEGLVSVLQTNPWQLGGAGLSRLRCVRCPGFGHIRAIPSNCRSSVPPVLAAPWTPPYIRPEAGRGSSRVSNSLGSGRDALQRVPPTSSPKKSPRRGSLHG